MNGVLRLAVVAAATAVAVLLGLALTFVAETAPSRADLLGHGVVAGALAAPAGAATLAWLCRSPRTRAAPPMRVLAAALAVVGAPATVLLGAGVALGSLAPSEAAVFLASLAALAAMVAWGFLLLRDSSRAILVK